MDNKQKTVVRVGGKEYTLLYDDPAYMQRVAAYVDRCLNETALAARLPVANATVLAAISLGEDLMKAQDENRRLRRELQQLREQLESKGEA